MNSSQLLYYLWSKDSHVYRRNFERNRVQISLMLSLMRPLGGFVLSQDGYYQSTALECILYRNVTIRLVQLSDGSQEFQARFSLINLQGRREIDRKVITITVSENRQSSLNPFNCPVQYLLALALHDGSFENVRTIEDLTRLRISADQPFLSLPWRTACRDRAIFRNFYESPWKYTQALGMLNELRQRATMIVPNTPGMSA